MEKTKDKLEQAAKECADSFVLTDFYMGSDIKEAIIEAFEVGANWQKEQSPWISVKDRLPEESKWVFVAGGRYPYRTLFYCAGLFYSDVTFGTFDSGVTHWMPIPE